MSVNIWDAESQKVKKVAGVANINDGAISEDSTWSSKKIDDEFSEVNVNLGELEGALEDKADKTDLVALEKKVVPQETSILDFNLIIKEGVYSFHGYPMENAPAYYSSGKTCFGNVEVIRFTNNDTLKQTCYLITNKTIHPFVRYRSSDGTWSAWQELATMDKIERYSTTETPIGTWIDGKTLYRRVIETTTPSAETPTTNGFKEKNIDFFKNGETHIVNLTGVIWSGSNDMPIPYIAETMGSDWGSLYSRPYNKQIVIHLGEGADSHFGSPMKIIVDYIK